jgi:hypothetical protein
VEANVKNHQKKKELLKKEQMETLTAASTDYFIRSGVDPKVAKMASHYILE